MPVEAPYESRAARFLDWHDGDEPMATLPVRVLHAAIFELLWWMDVCLEHADHSDSFSPPQSGSLVRLAALLEVARRTDGSEFGIPDAVADALAKMEAK